MAWYFDGVARTFNEYLLVPGYSSSECVPDKVSLEAPLVRYNRDEEPVLKLNIPLTSAIMQSVSDDTMAISLAREGGLSFIYGSQTCEDEAAMVAEVKSYKAGFVISDSNLSPDMVLEDVLQLKAESGHSTMPVTADGTAHGRVLGIVTSRDYRPSRTPLTTKVSEFMTPLEKLIVAPAETSLKEANDIIWEKKISCLPIVDKKGYLCYLVFRKD